MEKKMSSGSSALDIHSIRPLDKPLNKALFSYFVRGIGILCLCVHVRV